MSRLPSRFSPSKFGIYLSPFHNNRESPTTALEQDLDLITFLDSLGYDNVWVGENHSGGAEIIASPEVFVAMAAERTSHITLGCNISSLNCQHPLILADRMMQLDHLTRGRVAFSLSSGLPDDAAMMGISHEDQRDVLPAVTDVLVPLLQGKPVNRKTRWFELNEARLQLTPFSSPMVELAVASQVSPYGASVAGSHGLGLITISATSAGGFNALATTWEIYERKAQANNQLVDRSRWYLTVPVHIAKTRKQAFANVNHGLQEWIDYCRDIVGIPLVCGSSDPARSLVDSGLAVIGTPGDATVQLRRLWKQSGGFGCFLQMAHNWANPEATRNSYELFMEQVVPSPGTGIRQRKVTT